MSDPIDLDPVARALATAVDQLASVTSVVGTAYRWPGTVESGALADVLDLASDLRALAIDVRQQLAHVALIRCEANTETKSIVSPTGLVGWVAEGGGRAAYVRRMYGSELEAAR